MEIVEGISADAVAVMEIIRLCIAQMRAAGIQQWDEIYPNLEVVEQDIRMRTLHVIRDQARAIAAICLNEEQPEQYRDIPWRDGEAGVMVIHRLCVHPDWQAHGLARRLMDFAEQHARERGFCSIRLDAYTGHPRALTMYEKRGYAARGQTHFPRRPLPFVCFEFSLK